MATLYRIDWTEYEKGWGDRPDGTTLYLSLDRARAHIGRHWQALKDKHGERTPDEYSVPSEPRPIWAPQDLHDKVRDAGGSIWWSVRTHPPDPSVIPAGEA